MFILDLNIKNPVVNSVKKEEAPKKEEEKPIDLESLKSKDLPEDIITKIENVKSNEKEEEVISAEHV